MGTEIFKIDESWAEKLTKTRVSFLTAPTVVGYPLQILVVLLIYTWIEVGENCPSFPGRFQM